MNCILSRVCATYLCPGHFSYVLRRFSLTVAAPLLFSDMHRTNQPSATSPKLRERPFLDKSRRLMARSGSHSTRQYCHLTAKLFSGMCTGLSCRLAIYLRLRITAAVSSGCSPLRPRCGLLTAACTTTSTYNCATLHITRASPNLAMTPTFAIAGTKLWTLMPPFTKLRNQHWF